MRIHDSEKGFIYEALNTFKLAELGAHGEVVEHRIHKGDLVALIKNEDYVEEFQYSGKELNKFIIRIGRNETQDYDYEIGRYNLILDTNVVLNNCELIKKL